MGYYFCDHMAYEVLASLLLPHTVGISLLHILQWEN